MSQFDQVQKLLASLDTEVDDYVLVHTQKQLVHAWSNEFEAEMVPVLKGNKLFSVIAKLMDRKFEIWKQAFPDWIEALLARSYEYSDIPGLFADDQIVLLTNVLSKYVRFDCWDAMLGFYLLAGFPHAKQALLADESLFNKLKKEITKPYVLDFFHNCASLRFDPWKHKILADKELVLSILAIDDIDSWGLLCSLALHPDAKMLMPSEVKEKAGKSKNLVCINTYALLCSENDLKTIELDATYIDDHAKLLATLLSTGTALQDNVQQSLLNLLLPISNLSTADSCIEKLGAKVVVLLLRVVTDKLLDVPLISNNLHKSLLEASKALWNLAYHTSNCALIVANNGIERLTKVKQETDDRTLQKNIEGILHMCTIGVSQELTGPSEIQLSSKGHVMISYNWESQPIVKQLAQSLKDHGYNVWLDIEQMGGSTLEAMAKAVEKSEVVLMCMSQKYKDSPNCRLEGEYCVNRKVAFVPLMMHKGYSPDGWLGIALGAKLWYDFSDNNDWESKITALVKAIGERGKIVHPLPRLPSLAVITPNVLSSSHPEPSEAIKAHNKVSNWTLAEMRIWMKTENLEQLFDIFRAHDFTGESLLELKYLLCDPQQPHFPKFTSFQIICKDIGIEKVGTMLRFAAAIRKLP